jgi:LysR family transcriptional regulator, glycine cleavage system transcriptional activator
MQISHAEPSRFPSLNTLPAFVAVARAGSLTLAAEELCLTPSAVSRQIKTLEDSLGATLFHRSHNAVALTESGRRFLAHARGALAQVEAGMREISLNRARLIVQAPITLTQRWLIPRIDSFRSRCPDADLSFRSQKLGAEAADLTVSYRRGTEGTTFENAVLIDRTVAVCAPRLLRGRADTLTPQTLFDLPVLLDTMDAWSWQQWAAAAGVAFQPRAGAISFDTDEAAIDACLSGLGVGQANPAFIENEISNGRLVMIDQAITALVGAYVISTEATTDLARQFLLWLRDFGTEAGLHSH